MSKIVFKVNGRKDDGGEENKRDAKKPEKAEMTQDVQSAKEDERTAESESAAAAAEPAVTAEEIISAAGSDGEEKHDEFDKEKIIKYFKRHPKKQVNTKVERFSPKLNYGLDAEQVKTRFTQFLFNDTNKKYSRSYASIFIGNICTFFNLLCLIAGIALILANTKGITNYLVIFITSANIFIGIVQEIRSKLSIDKLSILNANTIKVVRDGEVTEIPVNEIVLDDVIIMELGNQVPADCILAEGTVEVNESLLTGESVAIKKNAGDILYAGSFISSGSGKCRVEKVGKETYIEKLTSKAKKYKRPNSELMNSTKLIIKVISVIIIPIAIGMYLVSFKAVNDPAFLEKYPSMAEAWAGVQAALFSQNVNFSIQRTCSVVIGMIPSGMLLLTSVALAVGIVRLAKNQTLVQDMYSLEMLARVNVLCLDKTGTITDGRMRVNDCIILNTVSD